MAAINPLRGTTLAGKGSRMRGAKAVFETLVAHGAEYLSGIPGNTTPLFAEFAGRSKQPSHRDVLR
jgi:thiamine pyrophosphate-dependent acetolactate synthase large subunit-like protein